MSDGELKLHPIQEAENVQARSQRPPPLEGQPRRVVPNLRAAMAAAGDGIDNRAVTRPAYGDPLLDQRGRTHGHWGLNASISQALKRVFRTSPVYETMPPEAQEALELISTKIGRILSGDPLYADHWDDIAGYAKLVSAFSNSQRQEGI